MKKLQTLTVLASVIAGLSGSAFAAAPTTNGGTISFTGKITDTTCTVKVNGGSGATPAVILPTISTTQLANANDTAGDTQLTIALSACSPSGAQGTQKASVYFRPGAGVDQATGTLINTAAAGATNVDLQLLDNAGNVIKAGDPTQLAATGTTLAASGDTLLPYSVRYHATGKATPGAVTASVVYDVTYN